MRLTDLPSGIHPPEGHKPDKTWRRERRQSTRREFLQLGTRAGIATGLAFASLMPTARRAYATDETPSTVWLWNDDGSNPRCHGSDDDYAGSTGCCACGSYVAAGYCGTDDWHKHHPEFVNSDIKILYELRKDSCGVRLEDEDDEELRKVRRNAWEWDRDGTIWRCSDGWRKYCHRNNSGDWQCTSNSKTVCPATV